jgi:hypothetical protein
MTTDASPQTRGADLPTDPDLIEATVLSLANLPEGALAKAAAEGLPDREAVVEWIERTKRLVLSQREISALRSEVPYLADRLTDLLGQLTLPDRLSARDVVEAFLPRLVFIRGLLGEDVEAAYRGDPAARSFAEIVSSYPAIRAIAIHRIAHELQRLRVPILPRLMAEHAHDRTGIDIHPGARIGRRFFIDHGTFFNDTATTREPAPTDSVSHTLPPITLPRPITVSPPRIVTPA